MSVSPVHPSRVSPAAILVRLTLCWVWLAASLGSVPAQAADAVASRPTVDAPQDRAPAAGPLAQDCQATITVQNLNDSGPGSLRQALVDVCPGGVVNFVSGLAGQTVALSSTLQITQSLTIDASSLTSNIKISGDSDGDGTADVQVFNIPAGVSATLTHLDILRGTAQEGGGISNAGTLTLTQSAVYSNTATSSPFGGGGGLLNYGVVTINNCTLSGNAASVDGGGLYNSSGTATMINSTLSGNTAKYGGGLFSYGTVTMTNSTLSGNTATTSGGGIYSDGTLTLTQSTVYTNTATDGGGIYSGGTATLTNSTLSGNTATANGGGIAHEAGSMHLTHVTLTDNRATNGYGGGFYTEGTFHLWNSVVAGNRAGSLYPLNKDCWGGMTTEGYNVTGGEPGCVPTDPTDRITSDPRLGPLANNGGGTLTHALLPGSPALDLIPFGESGCGNPYTQDQRGMARPSLAGDACDAGAFEFAADLALTKAVTPTENVPYHGVVTYTVTLSNLGLDADPGVWLTDTLPASVAFESWVISPTNTAFDGTAFTWQGALAPGDVLTWTFQARHTGTYSERVVNTAVLSATQVLTQTAAAFQVVCGPAITVQNVNNSGPGSLRQALVDVCPGGLVNFVSGLAGQTVALSSTLQIMQNLTIDGSGLTPNVKISGDRDGNGTPDVQVFNIAAGVAATLTHLDILRGTALSGGGIYNAGTLTLTQSTVYTNTAASYGGGIYNAGTLTLTQSAVYSNTAGVEGGGLYNSGGGTVTVINSTLSGNSAIYNGGGLLSYGTVTVTNSTLSGNTATYRDGGGLANAGTATINNSTLSGNSANLNGGGLYHVFGGAVTITNSTLSGNSANLNGGGLYSHSGTATVTNSTLSGNTATVNGGGIYSESTLTLTQSTVYTNTAANGGGVFSSGATATIRDSTLSGNTATVDGGGLALWSGTATITNSTVTGNTATTGGGLYNYNEETLSLKNSLVAGNYASDGADCYGAITSQGYNVVGQGSGCSLGPNDQTTADPRLGPLRNNGGGTSTHALLPGNPALDLIPYHASGCGTDYTQDQRGKPRPHPAGGACDAGAFEFGADPSDSVVPPSGRVVGWGSMVIVAQPLGRVTAVAAGMEHNLALKADGTVVAWGLNDRGQATVPPGLSGVTAIAAGLAHNLALKADGTVVAWGCGNPVENYGQCAVPVGLSGVMAIAAGGYHSLALKGDGTVVAWGYNYYGQATVPPGLSGVTAIAAGYAHSLALKGDGTVVAWGYNYQGQATVPPGLSGVTAVAAGAYHSLALKGDGTVVAWGSNSYGQATVPPGLSGVTAIAAGGYHSLALKGNGTVVAWGYNYYGQATVPPGLSGVTAIAAGADHSLALKADGTVVAWGDNSYGQATVPPGLSGVKAIAAGELHSLALKRDGTVVAWGRNDGGQATVPPGLSGVTAIAAGYRHSLALKEDGTVVAWGCGNPVENFGQCAVPVGLSGVMAIAAGGYRSLAITVNTPIFLPLIRR